MKDYTHIFAMMPIEAFMDRRLGIIHLRVLGAIYSWRDKNTNVATMYRWQIAERCLYSEMSISRATGELVKMGWLEKIGAGGRGVQTQYKVTVPDVETVAEPERVLEQKTVAGSETVAGSGRKRLQDRAENGCRIGNTLQKNHRKEPQKGDARKRALPADFDLTEAMLAYAHGKGISTRDARVEFERFLNHAQANHRKLANWEAGWRNWILKAVEFRGEKPKSNGPSMGAVYV